MITGGAPSVNQGCSSGRPALSCSSGVTTGSKMTSILSKGKSKTLAKSSATPRETAMIASALG